VDCGGGCEPCEVPKVGEVAGLDATRAPTFEETVRWAYSGEGAIQQGAEAGAFDPRRIALLRGQVTTLPTDTRLPNERGGWTGLPSVRVSILRHEEYGHTRTRADGRFDLVVNGGDRLTVQYRKQDYLPVDRTVRVPWREYVRLPDVPMTARDGSSAEVNLGPGDGPRPAGQWQAVESAWSLDRSGRRHVSLIFHPSTRARSADADGELVYLDGEMAVRVSEYSLRRTGPAAMPAQLPPTSAYTFAAELELSGALDLGAERVDFTDGFMDMVVPVYVDNFLGFPVGTGVPSGYYDRSRGVWVPSDDGRVVRVVGITDGKADLAVTQQDAEAGEPSGWQELRDLGVTDAERRKLAELYPAGRTPAELWRVPITHFSPWDFNWPWAPPAGARFPGQGSLWGDQRLDNPGQRCGGSVIGCESQTLMERIGIPGTPFSLVYNSGRVAGRLAASRLEIRLVGNEVPEELVGVDVEVQVAGRKYEYSRDLPLAKDTWTFVWKDRTDPSTGGVLHGSQTARVKLCYRYRAQYFAVEPEFRRSFSLSMQGTGFGLDAGVEVEAPEPVEGRLGAATIPLCRTWQTTLGAWDARSQGFGGWTLNVVHAYDPRSGVLYRGDGSKRSAGPADRVITTVAGPTFWTEGGGGEDDLESHDLDPADVAVAPDGSLLVAGYGNHRLFRVDGDGITDFPSPGCEFHQPWAVAVESERVVYVVENELLEGGCRVRKLTRAVGECEPLVCDDDGDGLPGPDPSWCEQTYACSRFPLAADGILGRPGRLEDLAIGPDGTVYAASADVGSVFAIRTDDSIVRVAGTGVSGGDCSLLVPPEDGEYRLATQMELGTPVGIAVGEDGVLFIADENLHLVHAVGVDGVLRRFAGVGPTDDDICRGWDDGLDREVGPDDMRNGVPVRQAWLAGPKDVEVAWDGSVYVVDEVWFPDEDGLPEDEYARVRRVGPDGILRDRHCG